MDAHIWTDRESGASRASPGLLKVSDSFGNRVDLLLGLKGMEPIRTRCIRLVGASLGPMRWRRVAGLVCAIGRVSGYGDLIDRDTDKDLSTMGGSIAMHLCRLQVHRVAGV